MGEAEEQDKQGSDDEDQWTDVDSSEDSEKEGDSDQDGSISHAEGDEERTGDSDSESDKGDSEEEELGEEKSGTDSEGGDTSDDSDGSRFSLRYDNETDEVKPVIQPEPEPFEAERFYAHKPMCFKELYGRRGRPLQIIVKLANIELTPEKPKYNGGSWHVEGKQVGFVTLDVQLRR